MPINANSRLRGVRKAIHGWKNGNKFYTSLKPRGEAACNEHATARDALAEASSRHLLLIWENPGDIDDPKGSQDRAIPA